MINVRVKLIASLDSSYQAETSAAAAKAENIIQEKKEEDFIPYFFTQEENCTNNQHVFKGISECKV